MGPAQWWSCSYWAGNMAIASWIPHSQQALRLGCSDAAAARYLMTEARLDRPAAPRLEVAALRAYERPLPEVNTYDALLTAEVV